MRRNQIDEQMHKQEMPRQLVAKVSSKPSGLNDTRPRNCAPALQTMACNGMTSPISIMVRSRPAASLTDEIEDTSSGRTVTRTP